MGEIDEEPGPVAYGPAARVNDARPVAGRAQLGHVGAGADGQRDVSVLAAEDDDGIAGPPAGTIELDAPPVPLGIDDANRPLDVKQVLHQQPHC